MNRFYFTAQDLARTRVMCTPGPLTEALFCVNALPPRSGLLFSGWRRTLGDHGGQWARPLRHLVPFPYFLDFFTVLGCASSYEEGIDALRGASAGLLREEIETAVTMNELHGTRSAGAWAPWVHRIPGEREMREQLVGWLGDAYLTGVDPHWQRIRAYLADEVATRSRIMARDGVEALLATLHPTLRWQSPVLTQEGGLQDCHLDGRGVLVAPSVFCRSPAMVCDNRNTSRSWILFYPAVRDPQDAIYLWTPPGRPDRALANLLGTTRARIMAAISEGRTTTELARSVAISPAAASEHATVLRDAGLVSTHRIGPAVLHTLTPLGLALVEGTAPGGVPTAPADPGRHGRNRPRMET